MTSHSWPMGATTARSGTGAVTATTRAQVLASGPKAARNGAASIPTRGTFALVRPNDGFIPAVGADYDVDDTLAVGDGGDRLNGGAGTDDCDCDGGAGTDALSGREAPASKAVAPRSHQ